MEWLVQLVAVVMSVLLAAVKSMHYQPNHLSEFELERLVKAGDAAAMNEQRRRALLPTYLALQYAKEVAISVILAALLLGMYGSVLGALLTALYFAAAYTIAARGWLRRFMDRLLRKFEPRTARFVAKVSPLFRWLAPKPRGGDGARTLHSRDELRQMIAHDTNMLAPSDKARLLGAFDFGSLIVGDAMVPARSIKTVGIQETIGPVLLDRLHKDGHNIFPVVKKDVDHIKGYLYMSDLTPLDPDLKEVKDAVRATVHYLPVNASLQDVLSASLTTGRQLFIVVNDEGKTKGLVTLADTLQFLMGEPVPKVAPVSTQPLIADRPA